MLKWLKRWWKKRPAADTITEPADHPNWDDFELAFGTRSGGCVRECACGRQFFNSSGGWDFEDGELDRLRANPDAVDLEWSVGTVYFEGREYVTDCTCWHRRARRILDLVLHHDEQIAEFLTLVKAKKVADASVAPVVEG